MKETDFRELLDEEIRKMVTLFRDKITEIDNENNLTCNEFINLNVHIFGNLIAIFICALDREFLKEHGSIKMKIKECIIENMEAALKNNEKILLND